MFKKLIAIKRLERQKLKQLMAKLPKRKVDKPDPDAEEFRKRYATVSCMPLSMAYLCPNDHVGNSAKSCPMCGSRILLNLANTAINVEREEQYATGLAYTRPALV